MFRQCVQAFAFTSCSRVQTDVCVHFMSTNEVGRQNEMAHQLYRAEHSCQRGTRCGRTEKRGEKRGHLIDGEQDAGRALRVAVVLGRDAREQVRCVQVHVAGGVQVLRDSDHIADLLLLNVFIAVEKCDMLYFEIECKHYFLHRFFMIDSIS